MDLILGYPTNDRLCLSPAPLSGDPSNFQSPHIKEVNFHHITISPSSSPPFPCIRGKPCRFLPPSSLFMLHPCRHICHLINRELERPLFLHIIPAINNVDSSKKNTTYSKGRSLFMHFMGASHVSADFRHASCYCLSCYTYYSCLTQTSCCHTH